MVMSKRIKYICHVTGYIIIRICRLQMASKQRRVHHTIHWFRKGLRLHDNLSLKEACETSLTLRPVYFIDPDYVKHGNMGFNRWRFLIQSLSDLDKNLKSIGSRLDKFRNFSQDRLFISTSSPGRTKKLEDFFFLRQNHKIG